MGQYVASEVHRACWHRRTLAGAPLLVYVQGSHATADGAYASERADLEALARAGFIVALADVSQTASQGTFGNTTVQTRIGQLRTLMLGSSSPLVATGPMVMVAGSGGVAGMLNYAGANPSNVAAMVGIVPLVDLQDLYENRLPFSGVTQAEVDTAYGGDVTASYATHDPSATGNAEALSLPLKLWYSDDDPAIPASTVTDYAARYGGVCEMESLGAVGHTDSGLTYESLETGDVADFLLAAL